MYKPNYFNDLWATADRLAAEAGLELVDVALRGSSRRRLVRVDVDRAGPEGVTLDDCQRLSRRLGESLDEADLIPEPYVLEISSPGIDRPIRSADDIRRNTGRHVVVQANAEAGDATFHGVLLGEEAGCLRLASEAGEELRIPLATVVLARQDVRFGRPA